MFLSKLTLNIRERKVRRDIARPYEMHRTLTNSYPYPRVENRCDLLFRLETTQSGLSVVLVQTNDNPGGWSGLPSGYLRRPAESKPLDLPVAIGQQLRFRLLANPTKKKRLIPAGRHPPGTPGRNGKRIGLATEAERLCWLIHKGEAGGFTIPGEWLDAKDPDSDEVIRIPNFRVDAVPEGRDPNGKPGHAGQFLAVRFDGVLVVTDPTKFVETVAKGVGSAKAFGFGLLSLARA